LGLFLFWIKSCRTEDGPWAIHEDGGLLLILVSNDDGVASRGLKTLVCELETLGRTVVVAPDRERSAVGHSLTLHKPLRIHSISKDVYSVNGTPTDCITLAVNTILREHPTLLVSGINRGANLGDNITYSGTVSAAMEGTLLGIPSMAVSLTGTGRLKYKTAAEATLSSALGRFNLVVERYPDLKATSNVGQLQEELTSTENKIGFSRQHYNDSVMIYNTRTESFPVNVIAGMFGFKGEEFFELEDEAAREAPKVAF